MPGSVLRAYGKSFKVDTFLQTSFFKPCLVFHKGEYRSKTSKQRSTISGMNIVVSDTDGDKVKKQIKDSVKFLQKNNQELHRLKNFPGVEAIILDFGMNVTVGQQDSYFMFVVFPAELIREAGLLNISLEISLYPVDPVD